jgi:hypothetical protein
MNRRLNGTTAIVTGGGRDLDGLRAAVATIEDDLDALLAHADEIRERSWYGLLMVGGLEGPDPA